MTFNPRASMNIDVVDGKFAITCPFWANDLLNSIPSKRWSKSKRAWMAPILKQDVAGIKALSTMAGVALTESARKAIEDHDKKVIDFGKRNIGFPSWYKHKLYKPAYYQQEALDKAYGLTRFALFLPMQTGKSKTAIDLTCAHRMEDLTDSALILVKRTLRRNWIEQLNEHSPLPFSVHMAQTGARGEREFDRWLHRPHDFKICIAGWESLSAGGLIKMLERFVTVMRKPTMIGDETTFIANESIRTSAAIELAHECAYRYALTGTPALEGPMNLFSQFEFLDPDIIGIGDYLAFRNRYAVMGGYMREVAPGRKVPTKIIGYQNLDELMAMIAPYSYEVDKAVALKLKPKGYQVRYVEVTAKQRALLDRIKKDKVLQLRGDAEHVLQNVLEVGLRLHQVTGGYSVQPREVKWIGKTGDPKVKIVYDPVEVIRPADNPKMREVVDIVREARGKQGIVWVVYHPEIEGLVELLEFEFPELKFGQLHGKVPDAERQPLVNAFKAGRIDWVIANAGTGGMGYTMMNSQINVFFNNTFKAIDRVQGEDRAWGLGWKGDGVWIDIIAERTWDMVTKAAVDEKMDVSAYINSRIGEAARLLDGDV